MNGPKIGQVRSTRMRRIGQQHMVVMPMQRAVVLSVQQVKQAIGQAQQVAAKAERDLANARAVITDLTSQLKAFDELPIERDEDDPQVPQPSERARGNGVPLERALDTGPHPDSASTFTRYGIAPDDPNPGV